MAKEIELKLGLPRKALATLRRHPLWAEAGVAESPHTLINTYYDTPGLALSRSGIALRTRKAGRRWLQTVKCAAASRGGLAARPEWESPYRGGFDFSPIDDPAVRARLEAEAALLQPVFTTDFRRETRRLTGSRGGLVLAMLDVGVIQAGDRNEALCELELELVQGRPAELFEIALALAADLPLVAEDRSKAARGYILAGHGKARPANARVSPQETPLGAFRLLAFDLLDQWQTQLRRLQTAGEPDAVHQMRVALRRLRTLLRIFADVLPQGFVTHWQAALRELAQAAGAARDQAALREQIFLPAAAENPQVQHLADLAHARSARAMSGLLRRLRGAGAGALPLAFSRDLHALRMGRHEQDLEGFAGEALQRLRQRVRKRLRAARSEDGEEALHALRIACKRLRYAIEFFAPLFDARKTARALKTLAAIQSHLGYANDFAVACDHLETLSRRQPVFAEAGRLVIAWHRRKVSQQRRKGLAMVDTLMTGKPAWR